jgi:quercetin dioxygenase-like cupin family protein
MLAELERHVTTLNPGQDPHPPHQHPEEELYIIKEGTVEVLINGKHKQLGAGSVAFAAANQPHGIRNAGTTPATYHVIKWRTPEGRTFASHDSCGRPQFPLPC